MTKPRTVWIYGTRNHLKATMTEPANPDCNVWFKALEILPPSDDTTAMEAAAKSIVEKYEMETPFAEDSWTKDDAIECAKRGWLAKAAKDRGDV